MPRSARRACNCAPLIAESLYVRGGAISSILVARWLVAVSRRTVDRMVNAWCSLRLECVRMGFPSLSPRLRFVLGLHVSHSGHVNDTLKAGARGITAPAVTGVFVMP